MKSLYLTLLMVFCFISGYAQINQVNDMDEVFDYFKRADADTLAVFDVDMVLTQPADPAFQMANMKRFGKSCKRIMEDVPLEKRMLFLSLMTISSASVLIDARLPQFIDQLRRKGIPAMALTANLTGSFGHINNMEAWRIDTLLKMGIDFSGMCPYRHSFVFDKLPQYRGNFSTYKNGMLFVNGTNISKGEVFLAFLQKADFFPKKIIFIDDREENLKSMQEALQRLEKHVEYQGLHYSGALNYPSEMITEEQFEARWKAIAAEAIKME